MFAIALVRSSAVALLSLVAVAQSPSIAPRTWLAADDAIGTATGDQGAARIVRGGNGFLVVWADRRIALFDAGPESGVDIFAERLDANGSRLDATPIAVGSSIGDDTNPQAAWNGENWLVSWSSQAPFGSIYSSAIVGRRVSPLGVLLDPAPFTILGEANATISTHASDSDGSQWVVLAGGSTSGLSAVLAARVSAQGVLLDPTPLAIMPAEAFASNYTVAFSGGVHLVAWNRYSTAGGDDIVARRFGTDLQPLDAATIAVSAHYLTEGPPSVASNGSEFLLAWSRSATSTYQGEVHAARLTSAGVLLDPVSIVVSLNKPFLTGAVQAAWDRTQWYLAWNYGGIELARISAAGSVRDPDGFRFTPLGVQSQSAPHLAASPLTGAQMVWVDARMGSYEGLDVYTSRVVDAANLGSETPVSVGTPAQLKSDFATDGTNSALAFRSETSGDRRILVARMDSAGQPLGPQPVEIARGLHVEEPSIGFDGQLYLIVWAGPSSSTLADTIYMRRMGIDGTLLDAAPLAVGIGTDPEVCGHGGEFLIAWTRAVAYPLQQFPNVVRVRGSDGAVLGGPSVINSNYAISPDVCRVGSRWLVVWQRNYWNNDTHCDATAAFVEANGTVGAPFWVAGAFNTYNSHVRVASSGNEALLLWVYGTASNLTRRLQSRRIREDGSFLDAGPVAVLIGVAGEQFHPGVAWDGSRYLAVFQDLRGATSMLDRISDVYAAGIRADGVVEDPQGVALEAGAGSEVAPAVLGLGAGSSLAAVSIFRSEVPFAAYRLATRRIDGACPAPVNYCTAKSNSAGGFALMAWSGTPSATHGPFTLEVHGGLPLRIGLAFFSEAGRSATPWMGGTLCLQPNLTRMPPRTLDATGSASYSISVTVPMIGTQRWYQFFHRDAAQPDGTGAALSDALEVTFCP